MKPGSALATVVAAAALAWLAGGGPTAAQSSSRANARDRKPVTTSGSRREAKPPARPPAQAQAPAPAKPKPVVRRHAAARKATPPPPPPVEVPPVDLGSPLQWAPDLDLRRGPDRPRLRWPSLDDPKAPRPLTRELVP
ncbi:MAG: hypothetical protein AB7O67_17625 [Vicinamibacterales bacterium]